MEFVNRGVTTIYWQYNTASYSGFPYAPNNLTRISTHSSVLFGCQHSLGCSICWITNSADSAWTIHSQVISNSLSTSQEIQVSSHYISNDFIQPRDVAASYEFLSSLSDILVFLLHALHLINSCTCWTL